MILMDYFCTILQVEGGAFWFALEQRTFFILRTFFSNNDQSVAINAV